MSSEISYLSSEPEQKNLHHLMNEGKRINNSLKVDPFYPKNLINETTENKLQVPEKILSSESLKGLILDDDSKNPSHSGGETDNDSEKDTHHALAAIHISDPIGRLKRDPQSPSPLTDDATGSIDSPDSSRFRLSEGANGSLPFMSSHLPKHVFDQHEVPVSVPHAANTTAQPNPSAFILKQSSHGTTFDSLQGPSHGSHSSSSSSSIISSNNSGSLYSPSQLYSRPPSSTGNVGFLSSTNPSSSTSSATFATAPSSFLTDDYLLLTRSQQPQASISTTSTTPSSSTASSSAYHLLTPLLSSNTTSSSNATVTNSTESSTGPHSHQHDNQPNSNKYSSFPTATPHSVSELYYPLRDLASLTPNMTSMPSSVSNQQVNSRSSPLQTNQPSRKQTMPAQSTKAGRGKAQTNHQIHGGKSSPHSHLSSSNGGVATTAYHKPLSPHHVPPGASSNGKPNHVHDNKRATVPPSSTSHSALTTNTIPSSFSESSFLDSYLSSNPPAGSGSPSFIPTPHNSPSHNNGAPFSNNMATIQQVKKRFSSVVKSSVAGENGNSNELLMSSINGIDSSSAPLCLTLSCFFSCFGHSRLGSLGNELQSLQLPTTCSSAQTSEINSTETKKESPLTHWYTA
jgi:trimeric autotransporter adhesin